MTQNRGLSSTAVELRRLGAALHATAVPGWVDLDRSVFYRRLSVKNSYAASRLAASTVFHPFGFRREPKSGAAAKKNKDRTASSEWPSAFRVRRGGLRRSWAYFPQSKEPEAANSRLTRCSLDFPS
jgi:hypothetical protein